jgi:NAD(P)-dependent dehydrogenase (short-subunit alcohol dehydrogenase family)
MPDARLRAMLEMAPKQIPPVSRNDDPQVFPAQGARRMRVALMTGCAQKALNTDINDATIRLLTRLGAEVVVAARRGLLRRADPSHGQDRGKPPLCEGQHLGLGGREGQGRAGCGGHQHQAVAGRR